MCEQLYPELEQVSYSYSQAGWNNPQENGDLPVFFVSYEFKQERQETFKSLGINRVPAIGFSQPSHAKISNKEFKESEMWMVGHDENVEAPKTLENLNKIMNKDVQLKYTLNRILMGNLIIFGLAAVAWFSRNFVLEIIHIKPLWYIGAAIVFVMCIGGTAYNMIHGVPSFKYARDEASGQTYIEEYF